MTLELAKKLLKNWDRKINISNGYYVEVNHKAKSLWSKEDIEKYIIKCILHENTINNTKHR